MSIEAMKLALEALEGFIPYLPLDDEAQCGRYNRAITALRATIEQAERQQTHSEECWKWHHECAVAKIRAAIEEAEKQEPVAWMYQGIRHDDTPHDRPSLIWKPEYMDALSAKKGAKAIPLYTASRQWQGLTDDEIMEPWPFENRVAFARWLEAKLKEKNG